MRGCAATTRETVMTTVVITDRSNRHATGTDMPVDEMVLPNEPAACQLDTACLRLRLLLRPEHVHMVRVV